MKDSGRDDDFSGKMRTHVRSFYGLQEMIASAVLEIVLIVSAVLTGFYLSNRRIKKQLVPAAFHLDEGVQALGGGVFRPVVATGHFHGRPAELRLYTRKFRRTVQMWMACKSRQDFTVWSPAPSEKTDVAGYATFEAADFNQKFASISQSPHAFDTWIRQTNSKNKLNTLINQKKNWSLELASGALLWSEFGAEKNEFTSREFPVRLEALAALASSLEAFVIDSASGSHG